MASLNKKEFKRILAEIFGKPPEEDGGARNTPYFIVKNEAENTAEVNLYGEVVKNRPKDWWTGQVDDGLYIVEKEFLDDIGRLETFDKVTFRINSVGGDADAGIAIYNRIRGMKSQTETIVDGLAASAASIIFMAGESRKAGVGSKIMIHGASVGVCGYYNSGDLKKLYGMVNAYDKSLTDIYADRTGNSKESIGAMLKAEKWLSTEEAVEKGFADEVLNGTEPVVEKVDGCEDLLIVNGVRHHIAAALMPDMKLSQAAGGSIQEASSALLQEIKDFKKEMEEEEIVMTAKELKDKYPDLVSELMAEGQKKTEDSQKEAVKAAVQAERDRIREIESIEARIGNKELVAQAKYGEAGMTAQELAFKAMQEEQSAAGSFLKDMQNDAAASGAAEVTSVPQAGTEMQQKENDVKEGADLIAQALATM